MKPLIVTAFRPSQREDFDALAESVLASDFSDRLELRGRVVPEDAPDRVLRALAPLTLLDALEGPRIAVWVDPAARVVAEPHLLHELGGRVCYVPSLVSPTYVGNNRLVKAWLKTWAERAAKGLPTLEARTVATQAAQIANAPLHFHFVGQDNAFAAPPRRRRA